MFIVSDIVTVVGLYGLALATASYARMWAVRAFGDACDAHRFCQCQVYGNRACKTWKVVQVADKRLTAIDKCVELLWKPIQKCNFVK